MADNGPFTLIVESSTDQASLALVRENSIVGEHAFRSDRHHNAALFEPLSRLLTAVPAEEIGLVLVGSGPGSYSGTRVGIAAAQGVALAAGCPCAAVPSVLATESARGDLALAIGDARRGSWWFGDISEMRMLTPPTLCGPEELDARISSGGIVFSFEPAEKFSAFPVVPYQEKPSAALLWEAWLAAADPTRKAWLSEIPQPIYLKPPHITPGKRAPFPGGATRP